MKEKNEWVEPGIKKLSGSTYYVRATKMIEGKKKEKYATIEGKAEARKKLQELRDELEREKQRIEKGLYTIEMVFNKYIEGKTEIAIGTRKTYEYIQETINNIVGKDKRVIDVEKEDFEKLKKELKEQGKSNSYINTVLKQLYLLYRYSYSMGYIDKFEIVDIEQFKIKQGKTSKLSKAKEKEEEDTRGIVYTEEQVEDIYNNLKGTPYYWVAKLGFNLGLRIAEIQGLRWENIDLENGLVKIEKQLQYYIKDGYHLLHPKSEKSKRVITIQGSLVKELKELKEEHRGKKWVDKKFKLKDDSGKDVTARGFVCVDEQGNYLKKSAPQVMEKILNSYGYDFKSHDMRKTHTSWLFHNNQPIAAISERLGHEDITTTLGIYVKLMDKDKKSMNDFIKGK